MGEVWFNEVKRSVSIMFTEVGQWDRLFLNDREHMFLQRRVRSVLQTKLLVVLNESFHEGLKVFRNRGTTQFYSVSIELHWNNRYKLHNRLFIIICNTTYTYKKFVKIGNAYFFLFFISSIFRNNFLNSSLWSENNILNNNQIIIIISGFYLL